MSLDTVIKIGKLYRQVPQAWQYHDQVNWAMNDVQSLQKKRDKDGNSVNTLFFELPISMGKDGMSFDFAGLQEIIDEDKKKALYYLNFKTSKKDAEKRYLFGDIVYSSFTNKKNEEEENGNYRLSKDKKVSSFFRCEEVAKSIDSSLIQHFRSAFRENVERIETLLKKYPSIVLHFNFEGKRWLDFEGIIDAIDSNLTKELVEMSELKNKVVLSKYLYKTLGGTTPGFTDKAKYKNRLFSRDEIVSLMYASKASEKPIIRINSIGILALPHSETLTASDIVTFFEKEKNKSGDAVLEEEQTNEDIIRGIADDSSDSIFDSIISNNFDEKVKFDIVFTSIPASPAGVFYDLIEITNIEKSLLVQIKEKVDKAKQEISDLAQFENPQFTKRLSFDIKISFLKILGDVTKQKKKFQFHLLKVLPQIYSDTYYNDPVLLSAFIEKIEYNIRNSGQAFDTLKYDFYFLLKIQKTNALMQITNSQSYALGQALGTMARRFGWKSTPIKSFEKSYVGNLSRRITSVEEAVKFSTFINEKLVMHGIDKSKEKEALNTFVEIIKEFSEKYNKYNCALGFFNSYYESSYSEQENNLENNS